MRIVHARCICESKLEKTPGMDVMILFEVGKGVCCVPQVPCEYCVEL